MESESPRIHQRANGKETVLCSKDTTFTFTSAHSLSPSSPRSFSVPSAPVTSPSSSQRVSLLPGAPQLRKPLCSMWEHPSMDDAGTRAAPLGSRGLVWVTVPLNLPWHLNPFKSSLGCWNCACSLWRMHTLGQMAHVLTNTVDNGRKDAPQHTGCSSSQEISAGLGCVFNV